MHLFPLTDILVEQDFGGKASGLSKINSFGLNVPKGFAVNKEAYKYYAVNENFPIGLKEELSEKLLSLEASKLIVRSSAIGEDADDFSFAGQLDSFVVENNFQLVIEGIKKCWDSINNSRVATYQKLSGNRLCEMGVVIQQYIEAEYSGVLFTQWSTTKDQVYVEYVKGGAEPLVSGKVTPFSFSVNSNLDLKDDSTLPFNHKILVNHSLHLREKFKKHLDIEWIYFDKKFHFVQARPIKIIDRKRVYWTNTNLNENYPTPISPLLYSIARDSYYHYFKNLSKILKLGDESIWTLEYDFSNSVGVFGNRIYYNMTSIHNILAASPYKHYFQDAFNKFVGYKIDDASSIDFNKKKSIFQLALRLIFLNISLSSHVKKIEDKVTGFEKNVTASNGLKDLSLCFYEFLNLRLYHWYHASLADLFSMIHYKLLGSFTKRIYGKDYLGIHNGLIQAIPDLTSNQPLFASWEILKEIEKINDGKSFFISNNSDFVLSHISIAPEWKKVNDLIGIYLNKWGFRCSGELMLTTENYIDSPRKFIELLQLYFKYGQEDPKLSISKMDAERLKLMKVSIKMIFSKRHILFPLAIVESIILIILSKLCRNAILSREKVRYKQAQMYYNFKKVVFRIGKIFKNKGLIENDQDILFFEYKEIGSLLASSNMFTHNYAEIIAIRKEIYNTESKKKFPESFDTNYGERPLIIEDFDVKIIKGKEFKGLAASGGKIKAKVKILDSVMEAGKIKTGEILVTKQTDPGWAMVFPIIGGLIVEHGGALSHGAIVAREFGIPAVLGIENITKILKDNDEVILDGDLGKIQIL